MRVTTQMDVTDEMLNLLYDELRQLAAAKLSREANVQTLQATALVHEAYMRVRGPNVQWDSRGHFFGAAGRAMTRILIERGRRKRLTRRSAEAMNLLPAATSTNIDAVHQAIDSLIAADPLAGHVAKLKLQGYSTTEAGKRLGISRSEAYRQWAYARARLQVSLEDADTESASATDLNDRTT